MDVERRERGFPILVLKTVVSASRQAGGGWRTVNSTVVIKASIQIPFPTRHMKSSRR